MFLPNNRCELHTLSGTNVYGEPIWSVLRSVPCAVVSLNRQELQTSVRADSSASRGAALEPVSMGKILFPAAIAVQSGDRITIQGFGLRISAIQPRWDVNGKLDHWECGVEAWSE